MDIKMMVQPTPNPYAKKIICNLDVKSEGKATFKEAEEAQHIPLAKHLFDLRGVSQLHFFENIISLTQDGSVSWDELLTETKEIIVALLGEHDPEFESAAELRRKSLSPELLKIEEILDRTVRGALQGDGGDLEVLELDGNILTIRYQGACGSCPSSVTGTLAAIQNTLRAEFDPNLEVIPVQTDAIW